MTQALKRKIFAGCRELGLDTETRKLMQAEVTGKESLADMTEPELKLVINALEKRGFKPTKGGGHKRAPRADLRLVHVLWKKLGDAGILTNPTREGLNAFIRRRYGTAWGVVPRDVDDLREWEKIDTVIQALLQWCDRAGVPVDREQLGR